MEKVDKHSIIYKNRIAIDNTFAAKVLWTVDCFTQLFLKDCHKCLDQEDVDQRVIDFDGLNMDIILYRFHTILPPLFHKLNDKWNENDEPAKKGKRKGASNRNEEELRNGQKKLSKITMPIRLKSSRWQKARLGRGPSKGNAPRKE